AIIGEEALSENDRLYLEFSEEFEESFLNQGDENRDIEETLEIGWDLLSILPAAELKRIKLEYIEQFYPGEMTKEAPSPAAEEPKVEGLLEAKPVAGEEKEPAAEPTGEETASEADS
ncbi:MAG: hypothetical protein MUO75_06185, partial [Actinobacteria bacterium]|nr:hypothetical protein [Actinomycetota bacterium]